MAIGASHTTAPREPGDSSGQQGRSGGGRWRRPAPPTAVALFLAALPLALLAAAAALGRHVRPSADEWCFLPVVRDQGIGAIIGKFYVTDNGRVGNGLLVGLYARFPVAGHQWYAALSALLVLAVLWALVALVLRRARQSSPPGLPLLVAATATAVFLLATPNTYKTLYWPAGSVSHTLAPVLACSAVLPALAAGTRRGRAGALAAAAAAGAFTGTLSEETSVVALVVLGGLLLSGRRLVTDRAWPFLRTWALTGAAGVAVGTAVLVTSPGSRHRRERFGAGPASVLAPDSLAAAARGFAGIAETVLTTWQYGGVLAAGILLGLLVRPHRAGPAVLRPCRPLPLACAGLLAVLVSGYLCTVITYPVFGPRVVTAARTWNDYLLLYVLLLAGLGALLGRALRRRAARRWTAVAAATAAALCTVSVVGLAPPLQRLGQEMRLRAGQWDRQDASLRAAAARGAEAAPYTPTPVAGMLEPFRDGGRRAWPARCVAEYYRLDAVTRSTRVP
ncbi:DUF6056 family protein [Streptomyces pacificus]|uniref:Uncharacterized protein n=1 Tax=Streptomyces pacificus TaxID=2705029 RepID=A0A6A0ARR0_9ACTN|nr:DUF6056 family protein [Streptomyces pacificus]GFH34614.1 hypothetical protein SCWH03_08280 [Streptomyces pacificus]